MLILVDYDNIHRNERRLGLTHVVRLIMSRIDPADLNGRRRVLIRLYGGWYHSTNFTNQAQNLSTEISANFPTAMGLSNPTIQVVVNCEMAYSVLADPSNHLLHTYRPRGIPQNLRSNHPSTVGCSDANCPMIIVHDAISNNRCTRCSVKGPEDILYRGEQKLVDTMMVTDMISSHTNPDNLAIVSSDDDFWPGIITTLTMGKAVIHIHTRNRPTPRMYTVNAGINYTQKFL